MPRRIKTKNSETRTQKQLLDPLDKHVTEALRSWRIQHEAGIGVSEALLLASQVCGPAGRGCFQRASKLAADGAEIDGVLKALEPVLPEGERATIAAGWLAGRAEAALDSVVSLRALCNESRKRIFTKLLLPAATLLIASIVAPLPGLFMEKYGVMGYLALAFTPLCVALGLAIFGTMFFRKRALERVWNPDGTPKPATSLDRTMLKIPLLAHVELQRSLAEFGALLSNLLNAGVPINRALQISARAMRNGCFRESVARLSEQTAQGRGFTVALRMESQELWPREFAAAVDVGERTGNLDAALARLAATARERYTRAIELAAEWLPKIIYGVVALFVIAAIFMLATSYMNLLNDLMKNVP